MLLNRAVSLVLIDKIKSRRPFEPQWRDGEGACGYVGYGRRQRLGHDRPITRTEAELLLIHDLNAIAERLDEILLPVLSLPEKERLVAWVYEYGLEAFQMQGFAGAVNAGGWPAVQRLMQETGGSTPKGEVALCGLPAEPSAEPALQPTTNEPAPDAREDVEQPKLTFSPELPMALAGLAGLSLFGGALMALFRHPTIPALCVGLVGVALLAPMISRLISERLRPSEA